MNWIKCSDRLPESEVRVLVFIPEYGIQIITKDRASWHDDDNYDYKLSEVTHWMPLPTDP